VVVGRSSFKIDPGVDLQKDADLGRFRQDSKRETCFTIVIMKKMLKTHFLNKNQVV
jgi:hypothetical protein